MMGGEEGEVGNYRSGDERNKGWIKSHLMCIENTVNDGNTRWRRDYVFYFT